MLGRLNATPAYRVLFGSVLPEFASGGPIDFPNFGRTIAEFALTFTDAPIDGFARGHLGATPAAQISADPNDRYYIQTAPLRNLRAQPAFFHKGATDREFDVLGTFVGDALQDPASTEDTCAN